MINYAMTTKQPRLHRAEPDYYGTALHRLRPLDLGDMGSDETSESSVEVGVVGELGASAVVEPEGLVGHVCQPMPRGGSMPGRKARPDYKQTRSSKSGDGGTPGDRWGVKGPLA